MAGNWVGPKVSNWLGPKVRYVNADIFVFVLVF